jgi:hypothetical protein
VADVEDVVEMIAASAFYFGGVFFRAAAAAGGHVMPGMGACCIS